MNIIISGYEYNYRKSGYNEDFERIWLVSTLKQVEQLQDEKQWI